MLTEKQILIRSCADANGSAKLGLARIRNNPQPFVNTRILHAMLSALFRFSAYVKLGPVNYILNLIARRQARRSSSNNLYRLRSKYAKYPIICRRDTTDEAVFQCIFIEREYHCLDSVKHAQLIIDCGANVGCSSAYFLSRFKNAQVIAIEPDRENFAQLVQNLRPYGSRAICLQRAVWPRTADLQMAKTPYRDGAHWARQVEESNSSGADVVSGIAIPSLIQMSPFKRISILKIDIEGAEVPLFADSPDWLDCVDNMVVELHDDTRFGNATETFQRAISGRGFTVSHCGELTVATRE